MHNNSRLGTKLCLAAAIACASTAHAQLEEVIVTAQKRSESLQDVPVAVTAFTAETMTALGVTDASDLVELTPGLSMNPQAGSNRNYYMRGVGTSDFHLTAASGVGQYFDGVTLTSGFYARAALFDMERVEVLKGPQNTLFGLNTTGGAVNYISRKPEVGAGTTGHVTLKVGTESLVNAEAAVGFDLGDSAAARISVISNEHDGGFESIVTGDDLADDDMMAYRAAFLWNPSDNSSLLLNIHGMENENSGQAARALGNRAPDGSGNKCETVTNRVLDFEEATNCLSRDGGASGLPAVNPATGDWDKLAASYGSEDLETKGFYLNFDHEFDWATLTLMTAYDNLEFEVTADTDASQTVGAHLNQSDDRDTKQYEARLVSPGDQGLRWIAGVYYLDEEAESFTGIRSPGIGGAALLPNVQLDHTKENLGVYGQIEFDFTDTITLTAGVRWSDEEIVGDYLPSAPNVLGTEYGLTVPIFADTIDQLVQAQYDPNNPNQDSNGYDVRRQVQQVLENDDIGYTIKLDWKPTEDSMIYASHSKGFKGGALDIRAAYALVPPGNIVNGNVSVTPETLYAWEVGYKASFMDNSLSVDAAAFFYTYEDLQQFITAFGTPTLDNAPESEVYGMDGNLKYASDNGFYLDLGISLLETEVTDAEGSLFLEGAELGFAPSMSFTAIASQDFNLSNGHRLTITANVNHVEDFITATLTAGNSDIDKIQTQDSYTTVNANVTYRFGSELQYAASIFGNNLTDEHFCHSRGAQNGNATLRDGVPRGMLSGVFSCQVSRATIRTYGASFSYNF